jgi:RND family efflux transporter MFP subunit
VDSASGTFEVQASIPNTDDSLRAGMAFTVTMNFPGDSFPAVDPLAVQWGSDGAYVWTDKNGKAEQVKVRIVQRNTENVLVAGDLKAGDPIITEGISGLHPGAAIEILGQPAGGGQGKAQAPGNGQQGGSRGGGGTPATAPSGS